MTQNNFDRVSWADPTLVDLFQKMYEQIDGIETLTASTMTVLDQVQERICQLESSEERQSPEAFTTATSTIHQSFLHQHALLREIFDHLHQRIYQLNTLYRLSSHFGDKISGEAVLATAIESVWQKIPLRFAVILLGETELGPYTYQAMRGVSDSVKYLQQDCPFPLWGILARALLPRLDDDEPDCLLVKDIAAENLPLATEFPWMPRDGALLILPLRAEKQAQGAILLGCDKFEPFAEPPLRNDFLAIAQHTVRALQLTQMQQELNARSGHLLSLQLFTKSIASVTTHERLVDTLTESISDALGHVDVTIMVGQKIWHRGIYGEQAIPTHIRNIIDWAMQAGQPIFYDFDDAGGTLDQFYYNDTGNALVVPILRNEQTQGAIQVVAQERQHRFEDGDMIILRTIANCAAIVLQSIKN